MKATLKQYRQSPRKVRLVADYIRGKQVDRALAELDFLNKRAAHAVKKLLASAAASAKHNFNIDSKELFVSEVTVDKGPTLHRWIARARGRATPINKRTSHITVTLAVNSGTRGVSGVSEDKEKKEEPVKEKEEKVEGKTRREAAKKDAKTKADKGTDAENKKEVKEEDKK